MYMAMIYRLPCADAIVHPYVKSVYRTIFGFDAFLFVFDKECTCVDLGLAQFKEGRNMTPGDYESV